MDGRIRYNHLLGLLEIPTDFPRDNREGNLWRCLLTDFLLENREGNL